MTAPCTCHTCCEADERNKKALFELELMSGTGVIDLPKLASILKGRAR